ncbi:MAG TPA: glutathione S-transferase family protein [Myxococcota bacterium]|nr:glutathione S-transferase family protein [Myxococcota bacterium]
MLTLFHAPRTRSTRILWLLEEIGEPYAIEVVTIRRADGSGAPDPRNPNPEKKVPALLHDGRLVTESAAICLYLTDTFPGAKLGPGAGDASRAEYLTWLFYYAGVVEPTLMLKLRGQTESDAEWKRAYEGMCARVGGALRERSYLVGDRFSAADILMESAFQWGRASMPKGPGIDAYIERMSSRPARLRSFAKDGAPAA